MYQSLGNSNSSSPHISCTLNCANLSVMTIFRDKRIQKALTPGCLHHTCCLALFIMIKVDLWPRDVTATTLRYNKPVWSSNQLEVYKFPTLVTVYQGCHVKCPGLHDNPASSTPRLDYRSPMYWLDFTLTKLDFYDLTEMIYITLVY